MPEGVIWQYFCKRFAFMLLLFFFFLTSSVDRGESVTRGYMPLLWL